MTIITRAFIFPITNSTFWFSRRACTLANKPHSGPATMVTQTHSIIDTLVVVLLGCFLAPTAVSKTSKWLACTHAALVFVLAFAKTVVAIIVV